MVSETLSEAIEKALEAVALHSRHDLNLGYRHAIWTALGPPCPDPNLLNSGKKRRTILAVLSVQHVLPIWEQARPHDNIPQRLLVEAGQILYGKPVPETAHTDVGECLAYMDNLAYETEGTGPEVVGYSAVKALMTAIWDEKFDPTHVDYNLTNLEIDPYDFDAAFLASVAYAGGPVWQPNADDQKRREFWEWWLAKVVPSAWQAVSEREEAH